MWAGLMTAPAIASSVYVNLTVPVRVVVTDGDVEIRYAIPTSPNGEATRFCHLQSDYRALLQQSESFRRVATRYDKLAANYLATLKLASVRLWLRAYESTP
jgi:hypothetical protein